jgi:disulfide bond formation protein DsbB
LSFQLDHERKSPYNQEMHPLQAPLTELLSLLTVVGHGLIVMTGVLLILLRGQKWPHWLVTIGKNGLWFALIVALLAMGGSLLYSDVIGLEPCMLCWYQRILMYPQVILLALANVRKDAKIVLYSLPLALIGAAISMYHYTLQLGVNPYAPCEAIGYSVSCSDRFILNYGYITIPMMALTAFLLIAIFLFLHAKVNDISLWKINRRS